MDGSGEWRVERGGWEDGRGLFGGIWYVLELGEAALSQPLRMSLLSYHNALLKCAVLSYVMGVS